MKLLLIFYAIIGLLFSLFSFGFIDPHFQFTSYTIITNMVRPLMDLVYKESRIAAVIYLLCITMLFILYSLILGAKEKFSFTRYWKYVLVIGLFFFLSYPAFSYDIFNYILTAKVTYHYHENPYLVMPIELLGEPNLAFTRAANKVALYGPTWILATSIPYVLSFGNTFLALYTFKLLAVASYVVLCMLIYKISKNYKNVLFFAGNPLVIIEIFISGHNDAFMMALAVFGIYLIQRAHWLHKISGWCFIVASVLVKGATIVLIPIYLFRSYIKEEYIVKISALLLFGAFMLSPLREEMYPWYAVWWLAFVSLLPITKRSFIHGASYALSLGLMLSYIPWIATREYGGTGPMIRAILTWIPLGIYTLWYVFRKNR